MTNRYWFDSFPGIDLDRPHPILDFYGTPYGGPESERHGTRVKMSMVLDFFVDKSAPYTTVSQNRGGIA